MKVEFVSGAKAWLSSPSHPNYAAAAAAIKTVYGVEPGLHPRGWIHTNYLDNGRLYWNERPFASDRSL